MKDLVVIGSDHAGFAAKEKAKRWLVSHGFNILDVGVASSKKHVDYPKIALKVASLVRENKCSGVLACGSGTGMCMAANKIPGIRAAIGYDSFSARYSRADNDANVLCLRGRSFKGSYDSIMKSFFSTGFSGKSRHRRRVKQIDAIRS